MAMYSPGYGGHTVTFPCPFHGVVPGCQVCMKSMCFLCAGGVCGHCGHTEFKIVNKAVSTGAILNGSYIPIGKPYDIHEWDALDEKPKKELKPEDLTPY